VSDRKTTRVRVTFETDAVFGDKGQTAGVEEMRRAYETWLPRAFSLKVEVVPPKEPVCETEEKA